MAEDLLKELEGDRDYLEDNAPPTGQEPGERGLTPDEIAEARLSGLPEEAGRKKTPGAFLLTWNEAKYLLKANTINVNVWTRLLLDNPKPGAVGNAVDQETILQEVEKAWKEEDISVRNLQRIYKKVDKAEYWHYRTGALIIPLEDNEGRQDYQYRIVVFINDTVHRSFPVEERGHEITEANNPIDRARLAEVPEGIKYLPYGELLCLQDLRTIVEALADKGKGIELKANLNLSIMPNSPLIDVFAKVGRQSIRESVQEGLSLKGEPIRKVVSSKGVSIFTASGNESQLMSADTDRVLKVFIQEAQKNGYREQTYLMPVKELANRIGLKDIKEATPKIAQALNEIYEPSFEWHGPAGYFFKSRLASSAGIIPRRGRGGSLCALALSKTFLDHLQSDRTGLYQIPENITKIRDDNAYKIAIELYQLYRQNAGKKNEGIASVKNLLKVCNIIPYEELGKDKGKASQRIIRPFTNALEYLTDIGYLTEWTFAYMARDNKGTYLTDEDEARAYRNYSFFSSLAIHYVLAPDYRPDYTNLIENRHKRQAKANKARAKAKQAK